MLFRDIRLGDIVEYRGDSDEILYGEHLRVVGLFPAGSAYAPDPEHYTPYDKVHAACSYGVFWFLPCSLIPRSSSRCVCDTCI